MHQQGVGLSRSLPLSLWTRPGSGRGGGQEQPCLRAQGVAMASLLSKVERAMELAAEEQLTLSMEMEMLKMWSRSTSRS